MPVSVSTPAKHMMRLIFFLILGALSACGGFSSDSDDDELTGPGVLATSPSGQVGEGRPEISVSFTEPVLADSFMLTSNRGTSITGTFQGNGTSKLVFHTGIHLNYNTAYVATVTNVRDGEGNAIGNVSWAFTTSSAVMNYHVTPDSHFFDVGIHNSSALSPVDGRTYVTYFNVSTKSLYIVSTTNGTDFDGPYLVDGTGGGQNVGEYSSLAIDGAGNLYVAYYHQGVGLKLATASHLAGPWSRTVVDTGSVGMFASLALHSDGSIHISYYDEANTALKYARGAAGIWTRETLDTGLASDNPGMYTSIKVNSDGIVHISYYDFHLPAPTVNGNLKYIRGRSGSWITPLTLDSTGNVGEFSSLGLYNSAVYIVYNHVFPDGTRTVRIITNVSGDWKHFDIVTVSRTAFDDSITANPLSIDPTGDMHIAYYINGVIYYATGILYDPAENSWDWATAAVVDDSEIGHGVYCSLVTNAEGKVSIAYYDLNDGDLKFAH